MMMMMMMTSSSSSSSSRRRRGRRECGLRAGRRENTNGRRERRRQSRTTARDHRRRDHQTNRTKDFFLTPRKNALRMIPYQNTHAFSTQKKGKKGVLTIIRDKKKERKHLNPSLGFIYKKREGCFFRDTTDFALLSSTRTTLMSSTSREEEGHGYGGGKTTNEGKKKKKKKYYAVARGRTVGVYDTWDECNAQVRAYPGASHKVYRDTFCISPSFSPFGRAARFCVVLPRMRRVANEPSSVLTTPKRFFFFFRSFSIIRL